MRPGAVALSVADVERARSFYEGAVGLRGMDGADGSVSLGAGGTPAVELVPSPGAPPRPPGTTGLFHLAILVPNRVELARAAPEGGRPAGERPVGQCDAAEGGRKLDAATSGE